MKFKRLAFCKPIILWQPELSSNAGFGWNQIEETDSQWFGRFHTLASSRPAKTNSTGVVPNIRCCLWREGTRGQAFKRSPALDFVIEASLASHQAPTAPELRTQYYGMAAALK